MVPGPSLLWPSSLGSDRQARREIPVGFADQGRKNFIGSLLPLYLLGALDIGQTEEKLSCLGPLLGSELVERHGYEVPLGSASGERSGKEE